MNLTTVMKKNIIKNLRRICVSKNIFYPILVFYYTIRLVIAYKHFKQKKEIIANLFFF